MRRWMNYLDEAQQFRGFGVLDVLSRDAHGGVGLPAGAAAMSHEAARRAESELPHVLHRQP